ncbi:ArsR/SmtB family transcription factor [Haladaptatus cibarius]|uniref:ArsR/SmtB family transcription factor n=1 Tax=Haladaptatus cibarius TaxID=453847 RepID=UPI000678799B|nr:winged helix-turn-helix domain-containing protein [Haladaptatus cibarius]
MVDFLPSTVDSVADEERDPRVVGVDSEDADKLLSALSSETGRNILSALYEEPATPTTIAERVDTSLQNVRYHLEKLEDGNLIEVADTAYSEKGREMKVYAPTAGPLVLFAGNEDDTVGLESALSNLLGGLGVLGVASLVVQRLSAGRLLPSFGSSSGGDSYDDGGYQGGNETGDSGSGADGNSNLSTDSTTAPATDSADETVTVTESVPDSGTEVTTQASETTETAGDATTTTLDQTTDGVQETATTAVQTVTEGSATAGVPPGLLFFLGGALILALGFAVWYIRVYRKSA